MNLLDCIGNTPYIPLKRLSAYFGLSGCIYAKLEMQNPFGSIKDRAAYEMVKAAEIHHSFNPDSILLEATSGNMGIALSGIAALKGYHSSIIMPENMPKPRQRIISAFGSQLLLTPDTEGMSGARNMAEKLVRSDSRFFYMDQFKNPSNVLAHELYTGPELLKNSEGKMDCLVLGVGTGATLTGCARYLKQNIPSLKVMAVEPAASSVLQGQTHGSHTIFGIGAGFFPPLLDLSLIDQVVSVYDEDAYETRELLSKLEGINAGPSSGAALHAAFQAAQSNAAKFDHITVILADSGERY
ncbi:MAG: pyridoxal-phosphate dependent enzyme [Clostridia bacterium]|nr:pyridoxal-phosphate dependent enzyme [Clostridia bacterium]